MATELAAVVLAGGTSDGLANRTGVDTKANVRFGDRPLVAWVLAALAESDTVDAVVLVAPDSDARPLPPDALQGAVRVPAGDRMVDSLALGLGAASTFEPKRIVLVSADLPWLTPAGVDAFLARAPEADLVYPVVSRDVMEASFSGQKRTYAHLREGAFTGGNLMLLRPGIVPNLLPLADRVYRARKNPLALASLIGWDLIIPLIARTLSIEAAEQRISALLGGSVRAHVSTDAALAADIDRPEHLSYAPPPAGTAVGEHR